MSRPSRVRSTVGLVLTVGIISTGVVGYYNRTAVADTIRLWNYTPSAEMAQLSQDIRFTGEGQRLFYAAHPSVEQKASFNAHCSNTEVHTNVLGCYVNNSIYVYDVTDSRLGGVKEVTAAHETLHAAYARLSDAERSRVDGLLQKQYDTMSTDAAFKQRFSVYDSLSTADKLNELHSIFGTELASLSPELETYYAKYFTQRSVVTAYYANYQGVFDTFKTRQDTLKTQIDALSVTIKDAQAKRTVDATQLNADIRAFNDRANNGGYSSQAEFNRDKAALQARAVAINASRDTINVQIDDYNAKVQEYNSLSIQTQDLQDSLSSTATPSAPSV